MTEEVVIIASESRVMETKVRCYSSYIYAERPKSFIWQERELKIKSIEKAWQEPGKRLFRVLTEDGKLFDLCYNEINDQWSAAELMI